MVKQRFEVTLNGASMASLADEIIVRDIIEEPADMDVVTVPRGNRPGMRVTQSKRQSLSVRVIYRIRTQDIVRRTEVRDLIATWCAKGGALQINTRPDMRLYVVPAVPPSVNSGLKWEQDLALTLTAYEQPYWEDATPVTVAGKVKRLDSGECWLADIITPSGNVPYIPATMTIFVVGTTPLTQMKITCDKTMFEFTGMNIAAGGAILIRYDEHDRLHVDDFMGGGKSLLKYRTAQSNDDLLFQTGIINNFSISADAEMDIHMQARGLWV